MSSPTTGIHLQKFRKYSGPEFFLAGGFVAGLVLFLAWLAWLPDTARHRASGQGAISTAGVLAPASPEQGVLDGITGVGSPAGPAGQSGMAIASPEATEVDSRIDAEQTDGEVVDIGQDSDGFEGGNPEPAFEDGQAIARGILDDAALPPSAHMAVPSGSLQTFFVEVMTEPGVFEVLQVNAESAEHARAIVHDAGGDARITRGPSLESLD